MKKIIVLLFISFIMLNAQDFTKETKEQRDSRMQWWREARFGLFIHWGLYAIPAGEWNGNKSHGEWIRQTAQIPLEEYDKFTGRFNPDKFNADEWVRMAKDAGMKYIVITSKHHDGFQLFNSKQSTFNTAYTPFKRDILKELTDACHKAGMKICFYHSIMDWHHPDYLPRREWETNRTSEGADFNRYLVYLKAQLKELLTNYGEISVLWFDGEWENTWNEKYGIELYNYVRSLQPKIIINNRVGVGRVGMEGGTKEGQFGGDFGTPEQQIPATGLPGVDWETCMTMNDHWGYNKNDNHWKSAKELLQMLADVASKGGNYLLNVGPTAEGLFPQASIDRLKDIGSWMKVNGESIYGTQASPFKNLEWGRCTKRITGSDTRLYLHVFNWPADGRLKVSGFLVEPKQVYLLSDPKKKSLDFERKDDALVIKVPEKAPDPFNSVIVLDVAGKENVCNPPVIESDFDIFVNELDVKINSEHSNVQIRCTFDGSTPNENSPIVKKSVHLTETAVLTARCFIGSRPVSEITKATFTKVSVVPAEKTEVSANGINYKYFEGGWNELPDYSKMKPVKEGTLNGFDLSPHAQNENFGFVFSCYLQIPKDDVYTFYTESDDGSQLFIGSQLVVDNNGLHGMTAKNGSIALAKGLHPLKVNYFNKSGSFELKVNYLFPGGKRSEIPNPMLFIKK